MSAKIESNVAGRFLSAGCEKLPEGPMRDNCEKKSKGGDDKGKDKKKDDKKPDFLKEKEKKSSESPKGVVAALTDIGKVEIFPAETPKVAASIREALQSKGGYVRIASGPNVEGMTASELYDHFEERWAGEVPEAFKKEWKNKDKDGDGKENEPMPEGLKKHFEEKGKKAAVSDFPYATLSFKRGRVQFSITMNEGERARTGATPYGNDAVDAIRSVLDLIEKYGVPPMNVEVIA